MPISKTFKFLNVLIYCFIFLFTQNDCAFSISSSAVTFYVAQTGDDKNPGTYEKPYSSIERAQIEIRKIIASDLQCDVTVQIRGGVYYLPNGLVFGVEDSGTEHNKITYTAFEDEVPILVGGMVVEELIPYKGKIVKANIPKGLKTGQVFENGRRLTLARSPNSGYYKIVGPLEGHEKNAFFFDSKDLNAKNWEYKEARVVIWPGHDWFTWEKEIHRIDFESNIIFLDDDYGYPGTKGNRYFLKNALEFLDMPGECQIDNENGKIFVWPRDRKTVNNYIISTANHIINVQGDEKQPVKNLHFIGLNFSISNNNGIRLSGVEKLSVKFCMIENARSEGVLISGNAKDINIYGNLVYENGRHGISLKGSPPGGPNVNHYNIVVNNYIKNCGRIVGHGAGIFIEQSGHNRISNNIIQNMPGKGIYVSGLSWKYLKTVKGVTRGNRYKFLHARNNVIANNHIRHVNLDCQDTGAICLWGTGRNNVINNNLIHDSGNLELNRQSGIYIDDGSDYSIISNNIVYNIIGKGRGNQVVVVKGIGSSVVNNIFVANHSNVFAIRTSSDFGDISRDHTYQNNIIYFEGDPKGTYKNHSSTYFKDNYSVLYYFHDWTDNRVKMCDFNIYYKPTGYFGLFGKLPGGSSYNSWKKSFDQNSIVADPMFCNLSKRDFRFMPKSPALRLGFIPIDTRGIGLYEDFPERFKQTDNDKYTSYNKTYYVATDGADSNPGTFENPFGTIEKVQNEVRKTIAAGLRGNITIKIHKGNYYLPYGLTFGIEDSGTEQYRITYSAFDDEAPVLIGGLVAKEWTIYNEKILSYKIPDGLKPKQVFENGRRLTMARTPNIGYYRVKRPVNGKLQKAFFYDPRELSLNHFDFDEAKILIWPGHDWFTWEKDIDHIDFESNVIELHDYSGYPMTPGNRYFIKNAFEFIDRPGEYQVNLKNNMIYLWPTKKQSDGRYIVSTANNIISIKGSEENPVRNLHFIGLNLSISNNNAIRLSGSKNCSVQLCLIENSGNNGVEIADHTSGVFIHDNLIRENGGHGVNIKGLITDKPDVTFGHSIENNHIHHCGRLKGHGSGVNIYQSGKNRITKNYIHDMPRHGINISGIKRPKLFKRFRGITSENHYDYLHSRNNLIAFNHIHHVNLDSQDTGAIYLSGTGLNNLIQNNLIHDSGGSQFDLQSGIYIDSTSDFSYISKNIIYNINGKGGNNPVIFAKGIGTKIINNVLVVGPSNSSAIKSTSRPMEPSVQHVYKRNVFYFENVSSAIYEIPNWTAEKVAACDYNIYYNPLGTPMGLPVPLLVRLPGRLLGKLQNGNFFKSLRMTISKFNMDSNSIFTDPGFVDIEKRNFRLREDSPAITFGFVPIDIKKWSSNQLYQPF